MSADQPGGRLTGQGSPGGGGRTLSAAVDRRPALRLSAYTAAEFPCILPVVPDWWSALRLPGQIAAESPCLLSAVPDRSSGRVLRAIADLRPACILPAVPDRSSGRVPCATADLRPACILPAIPDRSSGRVPCALIVRSPDRTGGACAAVADRSGTGGPPCGRSGRPGTDGGGTVHRIDSHGGALTVDGAPYDGGAIG